MRFIQKKRGLKSLLEYLICFLLLYLSGSAAISVNEDASTFRIFSIILIGLCFIFEFVFIRSAKPVEKAFMTAIGCVSYLFLEYLIYKETITGFFLRLLWIIAFVMIMYSAKVSIKRYFQCIYRIIILLASITLIIFFLVNIFQVDLPYNTIAYGEYSTFYKRYLGFFYTAETYLRPLPLTKIQIFRLQSFFWEPGVYAIYLVFALFYFVFEKKEKKKYQMAILLLSVFLTLSTTGICIGIVLFGIYWIKNSRINKSSKIVIVLPIVIITAIGIYITWTTKKYETTSVTGSYNLRTRDITDGLHLIAQRPLFGWGYKNNGVFEGLQNLGRGSSNGLITLGYTMGIVGLGISIYPFIASVFISARKDRFKEIVFSIIFILTNMTEPIILMPFMICMIVYQYRKCWILKRKGYIFTDLLTGKKMSIGTK